MGTTCKPAFHSYRNKTSQHLKGGLPLTLHRSIHGRSYILCAPEHNFLLYLPTVDSVVIISRAASDLQASLTCFLLFLCFLILLLCKNETDTEYHSKTYSLVNYVKHPCNNYSYQRLELCQPYVSMCLLSISDTPSLQVTTLTCIAITSVHLITVLLPKYVSLDTIIYFFPVFHLICLLSLF